jgi:hypothetical protein
MWFISDIFCWSRSNIGSRMRLPVGPDHAFDVRFGDPRGQHKCGCWFSSHPLECGLNGDLLRAEIANTVANPAEIEDEIRHLIAVLSQ